MREQLKYNEKIKLLKDLKEYYQKNYPDNSEKELWEVRSLNIWFILDVLELYSEKMSEWKPLSEDEITLVLLETLTPDRIKEMTCCMWDKNKEFLMDWLKEIVWILLWREEFINNAKEVLSNKWSLFMKCTFDSLFDYTKDWKL